MEQEKTKLWTKFFILTCFGALFNGFTMQMLNSTLSLFANEMWGSKTLGGYLTTVFNIGSILMAFFSGQLADRHGRRRCLMTGAALFAASTLLIAGWPTPAVGLTVRLIQGVAKGLITVASSSIVADVVARERMSEGLGLYGLGNTLSMAFGPMLALALSAGGSYTRMFLVCSAFLFVTLTFAHFCDYERLPQYRELVAGRRAKTFEKLDENYKGVWRLIEKKALPASLNYTVFFGSVSCILVFITVYAREILLLAPAQISLFYTCAAVTMFVARLFLGKVSDRLGALYALIPGHLSAILALIILAFFAQGNYPMFLACGALYGFSTAAVMPNMNAIAVVDSPKARGGAANATFYCLMDVGIMISSASFGAVIDSAASPAAGYRTMYLTSLGVCLISLTLVLTLFTNKARERRRSKGVQG